MCCFVRCVCACVRLHTGDVVRAALYLASEDDAVKTRTHIPLPTDAFSARLDTVASVSAHDLMPHPWSEQCYVLEA